MAATHGDVDHGWAWLVLLASYFNLFMCSGLAYIAGMFQLVFLEQFHGSVAFTSWITALFSSLMQLAGPLSSLIANCYNCRVSVILGGILMSVGLFSSSMTDNLEMLLVTFGIVAGVGLGLTYTASIVILNYFFVERRTLVTGLAFGASGLGLVIAPQVANLLFEHFSWQESLSIMAGAAGHVCVTGALMSPIHEGNGKSESGRCCRCLSRSTDAALDQEYEICDDNEGDETSKQVRPVITINDQTKDNPSATSAERCCKENGLSKRSGCSCEKECAFRCGTEGCSLTSDVTNRPPNDNKGGFEEMQSQGEEEQMGSEILVQVDKRPRTHSGATVCGGCNDFHITTIRPPVAKSFQGLLFGPHPRVMELKNVTASQSHQNLSNGHSGNYRTSSFPDLIGTLERAGPRVQGFKHIPTRPWDNGTDEQIIFVSRSPSLLGLIPYTASLNLVVTSKQDLQSLTSLQFNSTLEKNDNLKELCLMAETSKGGNLSKSGHYEEEYDVRSSDFNTFPPLHCNKFFWLLCLNLFVGNAGCGIFNIHLPGFITERELTPREVTFVLSVNGFALLIGRSLCTALAQAVKGNDLLLFWALHVLGGLSVCLMPALGHDVVSFSILAFCVGGYYGTVYAVLTPITIDAVGLANLATAFGIEMVCAGIGYFVSPPFAGFLVDQTNNYEYSMYCGGASLILAGMILFLISLLGQQHGRGSNLDDAMCADKDINDVESDLFPKDNQE